MSDTPETDARTFGWAVEVELAQKLERERDEARRLAEHMRFKLCESMMYFQMDGTAEGETDSAYFDRIMSMTKLPWEADSSSRSNSK